MTVSIGHRSYQAVGSGTIDGGVSIWYQGDAGDRTWHVAGAWTLPAYYEIMAGGGHLVGRTPEELALSRRAHGETVYYNAKGDIELAIPAG
jgi:hypothetical protein